MVKCNLTYVVNYLIVKAFLRMRREDCDNRETKGGIRIENCVITGFLSFQETKYQFAPYICPPPVRHDD